MDHIVTAQHKRAIMLRSELDEEHEKARKIGENLVRLVMQTVREAGSRLDFELKVVDFYEMGGRVGRFNHSEKFMACMVKSMYELTISRTSKFIKATDPATGKPRTFAATADKVTEQHRTGQAIGIMFFDQGEVKAAFVDYILAKDGTGGGLAHDLIHKCMFETLKLDREELRQQFVGFAADGQYFGNNVAEEIAMHLLSSQDREDPHEVNVIMRWLLCTWDAAHRLELTISDVRKDKKSVKRMSMLEQMQELSPGASY